MEEDRSMPIPQSTNTRRKSSTWKTTWNLKRQLSKVDMKIKSSGKSLKEKRNSIFYSDTSPNQDFDHFEEETSQHSSSNKSSPESDENTVIDNQAKSPKDTTVIDECLGREEYVSEVQLMSDEESGNNTPLIVGSVGTQYEISTSNRKVSFTNRPDNLDLLDENGCPIPPPRLNKKKLTEKRDQRLLSVPIIKFQKSSMCDLRDKEDKIEVNQQPTFAGQLMRRLSKF